MGFGARARVEKMPSMALVGLVSKAHAEGASLLAKVGAEAALIKEGSRKTVLKDIAKHLGKVPWGVDVEGLTEETAKSLADQGCDFFAFNPSQASLGALSDEGPAYFMRINGDLEERSLRAIEDMPVDAVILSMETLEPPLNLDHLMAIGSVGCMFTKYFLVKVPGSVGAGDLRGLRDIGVDGIVVDVNTVSEESLQGIRNNLMGLPRQRKPRGGKSDAVLPRSAYRTASLPRREDDDDDDEEYERLCRIYRS